MSCYHAEGGNNSCIVKLQMAREYHTISDTPQNPSVLPIVLQTISALHQERGIKKVFGNAVKRRTERGTAAAIENVDY